MHRAPVGNLQQPVTLFLVETAAQCDHTLDPIDETFLGLAGLAVGGMDPAVTQSNRDLLQGQHLSVGVQTKRHRRAGAQPGEHQIVGSGAAVETADVDRLVAQKAMGRLP
jgi:hypothetical protein